MSIDIRYLSGPGIDRIQMTNDETILFWRRGLPAYDIALGYAMLQNAGRLNIGHTVPYA